MKKNKKLFTAALTAAVSAALISTAYAQAKTVNLQVGSSEMSVNGEVSQLDSPPVIADGRTLVPIRAIVEALDGNVDWDNDTKTATLTNDADAEVKLTVNSKTAYYNGSEVQLDTAPVIINERTMLPIRFVAESFGYTTDWNAADKSITITGGEDTAEEPAASEDEFSYHYTDKDGNEYSDFSAENDGHITIKDKNGKQTGKYTYTGKWDEIFKNKKGDILAYSYQFENDTTSISINGTDKNVALNDNYELVDADGNIYEFADPSVVSVKDKSGKVTDEYTATEEQRYYYTDKSGNTAYKVLRYNGSCEDGFVYPDGKYAAFENNYDWSYMGSDKMIYNFKYDHIIITDTEYNKKDDWTAVPDYADTIYVSSDKTEYLVTGDMAESYTLTSGDKKIELVCDPEEEHNKKLFDKGEYGSDDDIYYNGSDGNTYVSKDFVFTVYDKDGKTVDSIKMIRTDYKFISSDGKAHIYSYTEGEANNYITSGSDVITLEEIMG